MIKTNDSLTEKIISCAYKVHSQLGLGFTEKIYHNALKIALKNANLKFETEKLFEVIYDNKKVGSLRLDLIAEDKVVIEVKSVIGSVADLFEAQVLSYLRITGCNVGLLINFGNKSCQVRRLML